MVELRNKLERIRRKKRWLNKYNTPVVLFLLGDTPASEVYVPTFRNILSHLHRSCEQEDVWNPELCTDIFPEAIRRLAKYLREVRPAVRMEELGAHWSDFHELWYLSIFRKYVENGDKYTFSIISRSDILWIRNVAGKIVEKNRTHFVFNDFFFSKIVPFLR